MAGNGQLFFTYVVVCSYLLYLGIKDKYLGIFIYRFGTSFLELKSHNQFLYVVLGTPCRKLK